MRAESSASSTPIPIVGFCFIFADRSLFASPRPCSSTRSHRLPRRRRRRRRRLYLVRQVCEQLRLAAPPARPRPPASAPPAMEDNSSEQGSAEPAALAQGFRILYQKTLPVPARPGLAAWSPQLDLIAIVTANENILLYRMNGQRVWAVAHRKERGASDVRVEQLQWRPDGWSMPPSEVCYCLMSLAVLFDMA
jgi:Anaphase-promoting complex subunit 4 WD40 domain